MDEAYAWCIHDRTPPATGLGSNEAGGDNLVELLETLVAGQASGPSLAKLTQYKDTRYYVCSVLLCFHYIKINMKSKSQYK